MLSANKNLKKTMKITCFPRSKKETDASLFLLFPGIFSQYLQHFVSTSSRATTSIRRQNFTGAPTVKLPSMAILTWRWSYLHYGEFLTAL